MWGLRQELVKTKQSIYFSKVNNENNKAIHKNCSKLTIKTPEHYHQWRRYGAFKVNFEKTKYINLVFLFLTLNKYLPAGDMHSHFYFCQEIDLLETCRKLIDGKPACDKIFHFLFFASFITTATTTTNWTRYFQLQP